MKTNSLLFLALALILGPLLTIAPAVAGETNSLDEHLEFLRPFLGKTWRGEFKEHQPGKPVIDISRWERALNGKAVRVLHSINDGEYGGESIIQWDAEKKELRYHYFTTAGFQTAGTMTFKDGKITAVEKVTGNQNGVTEVRSTSVIQSDGSLLVKAEYLKEDGTPTGGREVLYKEAAAAEVKFK